MRPIPVPSSWPGGVPRSSGRTKRLSTSISGTREAPAGSSRRQQLPTAPQALVAHAGVLISALGAGLVMLLIINTLVARDAFRLHDLREEQRQAVDRLAAAERDVEELGAPDALAARALALGMSPPSRAASVPLLLHGVPPASDTDKRGRAVDHVETYSTHAATGLQP